jgi:hypothetical protein
MKTGLTAAGDRRGQNGLKAAGDRGGVVGWFLVSGFAADLVSEEGGAFVVFGGDGLVELLLKGFGDVEVAADFAFEDLELLDEGFVGGVVEVVLGLPALLMDGEAAGAVADGVDGLLGVAAFEGEGGGGLGAVEEDEAAEPFVAGDVFGVVAVGADEVHEREGVVGVTEHAVVALEREPGHASVVELDEFAIDLDAVVGGHGPGGGVSFSGAGAGPVSEVVEVGGITVRPEAVGPVVGFHLENAEVLSDLEDDATVSGSDLSGQGFAGLGFVRPAVQGVVDVSAHRLTPGFRFAPEPEAGKKTRRPDGAKGSSRHAEGDQVRPAS